jgi:TolB-like protein
LELRQASSVGVAKLSTARLAALAAMSDGDFLAGHDFPENAEFQAWCLGQREETRTARALVLSTLIEHLQVQPQAALPYARTLVELRPNDEQAWSDLVRLLVTADRRREAEEQYDLARRTLDNAHVGATGPLLKLGRLLQSPVATDADRSRTGRSDRIRGTIAFQAAVTPRRPAVAVLPIRGVGEDAALPYLAEAISEDLVISLSRDRSLTVIADSGFSGEGNFFPEWRQIADRAGARYLVQGSVRHANGTLIVAVRLVDGRDGRLIWTERCIQRVDGSFAIDDQLARRIAAVLGAEVEAVEIASVQRGDPKQLAGDVPIYPCRPDHCAGAP